MKRKLSSASGSSSPQDIDEQDYVSEQDQQPLSSLEQRLESLGDEVRLEPNLELMPEMEPGGLLSQGMFLGTQQADVASNLVVQPSEVKEDVLQTQSPGKGTSLSATVQIGIVDDRGDFSVTVENKSEFLQVLTSSVEPLITVEMGELAQELTENLVKEELVEGVKEVIAESIEDIIAEDVRAEELEELAQELTENLVEEELVGEMEEVIAELIEDIIAEVSVEEEIEGLLAAVIESIPEEKIEELVEEVVGVLASETVSGEVDELAESLVEGVEEVVIEGLVEEVLAEALTEIQDFAKSVTGMIEELIEREGTEEEGVVAVSAEIEGVLGGIVVEDIVKVVVVELVSELMEEGALAGEMLELGEVVVEEKSGEEELEGIIEDVIAMEAAVEERGARTVLEGIQAPNSTDSHALVDSSSSLVTMSTVIPAGYAMPSTSAGRGVVRRVEGHIRPDVLEAIQRSLASEDSDSD
ncbi:hypothetical protein [Candidatus Ichthyocystis hellenicum]|uniref:hypothetical protein n=2 Tax=Candidatus Ichthyocystis TaxID=2929841 RepID=UPI001112A9C4|nr:hypothetical protein [Candidatus Ichthyocystis hellenicum]